MTLKRKHRRQSPPQRQRLHAIDETIEAIRRDIDLLSVDEIREAIRPHMVGLVSKVLVFEPGTFLYRARKLDAAFVKNNKLKDTDISYAPAPGLGRANRAGLPAFYCSLGKEPIFFEVPDLKDGDELIVGFWKTDARLLLNNIGYTDELFKLLGATRECPGWSVTRTGDQRHEVFEAPDRQNVMPKSGDPSGAQRAFSRAFMHQPAPSQSNDYKVSAAISELFQMTIADQTEQLSGIIYPSVKMWANGDNVALNADYVDAHLSLLKAVHVRIKSRDGTKFETDRIDCAMFDGRREADWIGHIPNWQIMPKQEVKCQVVPGLDEYGDYEMSKDKVPCHWELTDVHTGKKLAPS